MNLQDTKNKLAKLGIGLRPILFSTPMVQAIINGNKTQTRREGGKVGFYKEKGFRYWGNKPCKYGKAGDILWVRETWCLTQPFGPEDYFFGYKTANINDIKASEKFDYSSPDIWKPSIHMPFEAARIFLRIKTIKLERLNDISSEDCLAEGLNRTDAVNEWYYYANCYNSNDPILAFKQLWESINGTDSWDANPFVWVIEFERISLSDIYV